MVRGGNGRLVAATIALLERQSQEQNRNDQSQPVRTGAKESDSESKEMIESSMDGSTIKSNSSTDSGKDDQSIITSNSSTTSNSNEALDTICCKDDFQWVGQQHKPQIGEGDAKSETRSRDMKRDCGGCSSRGGGEVRLRKTSASLDRKKASRRERDAKSKSTSGFHKSPGHRDCCSRDFSYCDYVDRIPPPHDFRIPYYYRPPPLPCDYPFRCVHKPTNELQEQLQRLESDREALLLQIAVLTDQVEAQSEKINDLQRAVSDQKRQISSSEDLLQREMLTRSGLETQKLELLAVVSELKRHESLLEKDNIELRDRLAEEKRRNKPPIAPRNHLYPQSPTPILMADMQGMQKGQSPSPSPVSSGQNTGPRKLEFNEPPHSPQRMNCGQYRSLPREHQQDPAGQRRTVVFGRPVDQPRCSSVPNLAESESTIIGNDHNDNVPECYPNEPNLSMQTSAPKRIQKFFGKMQRSGSGNLDDISSDEPFARGGIRSTAGPRLCGNMQAMRNDKPFSEWTSDNICEWLKELGLDSSVPEARRWVKSGQMLLTASSHEIDKELNVKSGILRKKLHLALEAERGFTSGDPMLECAGRLEPGWVLRWLDDIGLPQYKGAFMSARLDGRVLHRLSLDDLQWLHINLTLHVLSIKAGIYVLRKEKFDPHCLIRRSDPENETEDRVELWTNHRVMEWLRAVDLAEYAPNLRGSGVHGGLMVHEDRFTETLLASLLSIPAEKTLLRRHLATHFKELLGSDVIQKKREAESTLGYVPLTPSLKAKVPKKSQFTLKRKKSKYDEEEELVCPLNDSKSSATGDSSTDLGKSPNHAVASPDKTSLSSEGSGKKRAEKISEV